MNYLLLHADEDLSVSGNLMSLTWRNLAMMDAAEIQTELRHKSFSQDAIVFTLDHYAHYMRNANVNRCIYANTPELLLIARSYSLNIAVYQVDPCGPLHYVLIQDFVGDPNNSENVVYLLLNGNYYQRIITGNLSYSDNDHCILHLIDTLTDSHFSNDDCHERDISITMYQSYQDDFAIGRVDESTSITEESTSNVNQDLDTVRASDDLYCQMCNNDLNSLTFLESISQESLNFTQEISYENVPDEASVAHATI